MTDACPLCDEPAGEVSHSLAPGQNACTADHCPVTTWEVDDGPTLRAKEVRHD